ncbi:MAG: hypothetical protein BVN31_13780 [Proteobacteria bacterium ST_bin15]|nr:MAG: hypothetical protein BVN31_13780 [Proteobacteria bacterium ST_bin15]
MPPILDLPFDALCTSAAEGLTFKLHASDEGRVYPPHHGKNERLDSSASSHLPKKHTAIKNCPIKRQPA